MSKKTTRNTRREPVPEAVPPTAYQPETLAQLAKRVGKSRVTVWKWVREGVVIGTSRVKLRGFRIGAQWVVDREMYDQFIKDCNPEQPTLPESPAAEARRLKADQLRARILIG